MLDNPRSPRVRAVAKLANRAARSETGLFLLEGPQAVAEALTYRPELVVELYATPTALERYTDIADTAVEAGVDVEFVTEQVLETMADTVTPQGFVAVCHQFPTSVKDIFGVVVFLGVFSAIVFFAPEMGGYFLERPILFKPTP